MAVQLIGAELILLGLFCNLLFQALDACLDGGRHGLQLAEPVVEDGQLSCGVVDLCNDILRLVQAFAGGLQLCSAHLHLFVLLLPLVLQLVHLAVQLALVSAVVGRQPSQRQHAQEIALHTFERFVAQQFLLFLYVCALFLIQFEEAGLLLLELHAQVGVPSQPFLLFAQLPYALLHDAHLGFGQTLCLPGALEFLGCHQPLGHLCLHGCPSHPFLLGPLSGFLRSSVIFVSFEKVHLSVKFGQR